MNGYEVRRGLDAAYSLHVELWQVIWRDETRDYVLRRTEGSGYSELNMPFTDIEAAAAVQKLLNREVSETASKLYKAMLSPWLRTAFPA